MRVITLSAVLFALSSGSLAAQEPASPESIRPQDTEPSIPVQTPTLGEQRPAGTEGAGQTVTGDVDPNTPVSSAGEAGGVAATGQGQPGALQQGAESASPLGGSGLPERSAAPRTLRAHWHVYIAFTVAWVLLFGYALSIGWRMNRLEQELTRQRGLLD